MTEAEALKEYNTEEYTKNQEVFAEKLQDPSFMENHEGEYLAIIDSKPFGVGTYKHLKLMVSLLEDERAKVYAIIAKIHKLT